MGIRETINQRPGLMAGCVAGLIAVLAVGSVMNANSGMHFTTKAYFSDDDGKTYFVDSVDKVIPFDHNGKPAVRAMVYRCNGGGDPFVSYLIRYNEASRSKLESLLKDPQNTGEANTLRNNSSEVKKPGDKTWVPLFSPKGESISMHPLCPDGNRATNISP